MSKRKPTKALKSAHWRQPENKEHTMDRAGCDRCGCDCAGLGFAATD